jgi:16S rRNA (cytosine967-C5)-methyltransferase
MKLHRNLIIGIVDTLTEVLINNRQADSTLEKLFFTHKEWGARDRGFISGYVYTIIRFKRRYEYCLGEEVNADNIWKITGAAIAAENIILPDWEEWNGLNAETIKQKYEEAKLHRSIWQSIPDWLDKMGEKQLGNKWNEELSALNEMAKFAIRVNAIKSNVRTLTQLLKADEVPHTVVEEVPGAVIINARKNFRNYTAYKNGLFEIQDVSSQLVAPALEVKEGMRVIDACAGAGGKTLHIAALMRNSGSIMAFDVSEVKLVELDRRAERAGVRIITTKPINEEVIAKYNSWADRLLLDVPCSGTGVLRRKPDAKWVLTETFMEEVKQKQQQILQQYSVMLKPGGKMVYSTCSILPAENQEQVKSFLAKNLSFTLQEEKVVSPAQSGYDGFYIAVLEKK